MNRNTEEVAAEAAIAELLKITLAALKKLEQAQRVRIWYTVAEFYEIPYKRNG